MRKWFLLMPVGVVILAGCAQTVQITDLDHSGFLGDYYDKLEPGEGRYQASYRYINESANIAGYRKVILDPILFFGDEEHEISAEDRQAIANNFYIAIRNVLAEDLELVDAPGPDTARYQFAIVKATKKRVFLDTISTLTPIGLGLSSFQQYRTGRPTFTGSFAIESELRDSETGEVIIAAIDERVGGKSLSGEQFNAWADVNNIINLYAKILRFRGCQLRGQSDCAEPSS